MQPRRTISLAGIVLLLAVQAGLKAGTTTVVVPSFPPSHSYGGPAGAPNAAAALGWPAIALAQAGSSAVAQAPPSVTFQVEVNYVDTPTVFAEIYDNSSGRQPRQIDTVITMLSEGGQDVFRAAETIDNPPASRWTTYGLTRDIPLNLNNVRRGDI